MNTGKKPVLKNSLGCNGSYRLLESALYLGQQCQNRKGRETIAIIGAHILLYSSEPEVLGAKLRDAFGFESVNAGDGWRIFALPPAGSGYTLLKGQSMIRVSGIRSRDDELTGQR